MLLQIMREYSCLPSLEELTVHKIVFFYEGQRGSLKKATKPN